MITQSEPKFFENAILHAVEDSASFDAWTIDELNQCTDLESVHDAWSHTVQLAA